MLGGLRMLGNQSLQPSNLLIFDGFSSLLVSALYAFEGLLDLRLIDDHVFVELPLVLLEDVCEVFDGGLADGALVALMVGNFRD